MKTTLETLAELYRAAFDQQLQAERGMERIYKTIENHGFTVDQVRQHLKKLND